MRAWLWAVPAAAYPVFVRTGTFALHRQGRPALAQVQPGDVIFAYLSGRKVIAGMFEAVGETFRDTTPLVPGRALPHRLRVRPLVTLSDEAGVPYEAFADKLTVRAEYASFRGVVQQVLHPLPRVDEKVLEFLVRARQATDLPAVLAAYDAYLRARDAAGGGAASRPPAAVHEAPAPYQAPPAFDPEAALEALLAYVAGQGFIYEPWQVAAYVTALRTKPFVILAGVTGTGKSRLPALVAAGTGGALTLVPVRPDWSDSADVLGYVDLQGRFRPGALLEAAAAAREAPDRFHTVLLDEMNLARVEHYFAEVLSHLEGRRAVPEGGAATGPLLARPLHAAAGAWAEVGLPPNLALVGTVNVDESTYAFSRKVLDRAFTIELSAVDLTAWGPPPEAVAPAVWPVAAWYPLALRPAALRLDEAARARAEEVVAALERVNAALAPAQLQAGYRTRDEAVLFVLHAQAVRGAFRTRTGGAVDPLDLALYTKVLPRLAGGSSPLGHALAQLLAWALGGGEGEAEGGALLEAWEATGRPDVWHAAAYPFTAGRLALMLDRLHAEGFTSFWT